MRVFMLMLLCIFLHVNFAESQKMNLTKLDRIETFAEIFSDVRYFYPIKYSSNQWDLFLADGVTKIEKSRDNVDFIELLNAIFKNITPKLIISNEIIKKQRNKFCKGKNKQVFWQYEGFAESKHGQYENRLINIDDLPKKIGFLSWLDDLYNLENCMIEFSAQVRSDNPRKNKLKTTIFGFDRVTKKKSSQILVSSLSTKWNDISWQTKWNQGNSYLSFLFELVGSSSIQLKNINFKITLRDTIFDHGIPFNDSTMAMTTIKRPFGYDYIIDSDLEIMTINRIDSLNNKLMFASSPAPNEWMYSATESQVNYAFPISMSKSEYNKSLRFTPISTSIYDSVIENKLASVVKVYSVVKTFFPYKKEIELNTGLYLKKYLALMNGANTKMKVYETLKKMVAELKDGHAVVIHDLGYLSRCINADFRNINGKVIVSGSGENELMVGDEIINIDGKFTSELLDERKNTRSGSSQWKTYMETMIIGCENEAKDCELIYLRNKDTLNCYLKRDSYALSNTDDFLPAFKNIQDDIFYVDLTRLSYSDFCLKLDSLQSAKGIVFDLRGYPSISPKFLSHLTKTKIYSAKWETPLIRANLKAKIYDTTGIWEIKPIAPHLTAKSIFLINSEVISYGESLLSIIKHYNLGTTIGSKSAGVNGNKTQFKAPGGFTVFFTGMKVSNHDGSQLFENGITPDINWEMKTYDIENETKLLVKFALSIINK